MLCESMPDIMWFLNDNRYSECHLLFHYIILPEPKEETMTVKIWHGEFCYEKSLEEILSERTFPITAEGRKEMIEYIRSEDYAFRQ